MKLLMLTWNYPPTVGGIEQVAHHTATGLRKLGQQVDVVAAALPKDASDPRKEEPSIQRARRPGLLAFLFFALRTGLKRAVRDRPDIILCPSLTSAPAAWVIALFTRVPYVVFIHGSDLLVQRRLYQWSIAPLLSGARGLFANSRNTARLLTQRGLKEERIHVVCPGVTPPPPVTDQPSEEIARLLQAAQGRPIILTVGRLVRRKGIREFIEHTVPLLAEDVPDMLYLVVGGEPKASLIHHERIQDQLEQAISAGGHQDRVKLLGRLSDADLAAVYQQAQLFVLPCLLDPADVEGFGIVILEAALRGVPSVATRCGGIPDAIEDGTTGVLVEPGRFDEMANVVSGLLRNPDRLAELGTAAQQRTRANFTWEAVSARYEAGLTALAPSRPR